MNIHTINIPLIILLNKIKCYDSKDESKSWLENPEFWGSIGMKEYTSLSNSDSKKSSFNAYSKVASGFEIGEGEKRDEGNYSFIAVDERGNDFLMFKKTNRDKQIVRIEYLRRARSGQKALKTVLKRTGDKPYKKTIVSYDAETCGKNINETLTASQSHEIDYLVEELELNDLNRSLNYEFYDESHYEMYIKEKYKGNYQKFYEDIRMQKRLIRNFTKFFS